MPRATPRVAPLVRAHQRRGYISRDWAVRQARQCPQVAMLRGVDGAPHSGHSTDSWACDRASSICFDRSSWRLRFPRQGQPSCASSQRPGVVGTGCLLGKRRTPRRYGPHPGVPSRAGIRVRLDMSTARLVDPSTRAPGRRALRGADLRLDPEDPCRSAWRRALGGPPMPSARGSGVTRTGDERNSVQAAERRRAGQACRRANVATACTRLRSSCSTSASQTVRCFPRVRTLAVTSSGPGLPGRR